MNEERAKEIFLAALERPADERSAFLASACGGDEQLERDVLDLLALDAGAEVEAWTRRWDALAAGLPGSVASTDVVVGDDVDGYVLDEELGRGGFGVVFRASQSEPVVRRVALKVLKLGMDSRAILARFEAERRVLARMEHPNIARILDAGVTKAGRPYFVMEYFAGIAITRFVRDAQSSIRARLELFLQACRAIQHAHNKGVIHRDLKPSNVLVGVVDGRAVAKVIDFGVAKAVDRPLLAASLATSDGQMVGTPAYMSPEQAGGDLDVDTRSDVYMLGALLYELLSGRPPFELQSLSLPELLCAVRETDPRPPGSVAEWVGRRRPFAVELDWIVMRCLEKDRSRRYPTAVSLAQDVERFLAGEPIEAAPRSATYRLRKLARRHRVAFTSAVLVVLALVTGIAGLSAGLVAARAARKRATAQQLVAEDVVAILTEDVLGRAVPSIAPGFGTDVSVREVLDEAWRQIESGEPGCWSSVTAPEVQARICSTIGSVYYRLGESAAAVEPTRLALRLFEETEGDVSQNALVAASDLVQCLRDVGRSTESAALEQRLLEQRDALLERGDEASLKILRRVAIAKFEGGDRPMGSVLLDSALARARATLGTDHRRYRELVTTSAIMADALGEARRAIELFEEAWALDLRLRGREDPGTLVTGVNLAVSYIRRGRSTDARALLEELLPDLRRVYGEQHPTTTTAIANLGVALTELSRPEEALEHLDRALANTVTLYGDDHLETLLAERRIADALHVAGELQDAYEILEDIAYRADELLGPEAPDTLELRMKRSALALVLEDRTPEVEEQRALILELEGTLGPRAPQTLAARGNLAAELLRRGDTAQAEAEYRAVLDDYRSAGGADDPRAIRTLSDLAATLVEARRVSEALPLAIEAVRRANASLDPEDEDRAFINRTLGDVLASADSKEAVVAFARVKEQFQPGEGKVELATVVARIAQSLRKGGHEELAAGWEELAEVDLGQSAKSVTREAAASRDEE